MLDIKFIRENPDQVKESLLARNSAFDLDNFLRIDKERRELVTKVEAFLAQQNRLSQEIKESFKEKKDASSSISKSKELKIQIETLKDDLKSVNQDWVDQSLKVPNLVDPSLPKGDASFNKIVREVGKKPGFNFSPQDHIQLAKNLDIIDFERATKITGSNFACFKGWGSQLVRALINFMLDLHVKKNGYLEVWPPKIVNRGSMQVTGQLPNLEDDMYKISGTEYFLIPTAEVPVTSLHSNEVLAQEDLPISYVAYTPCFRKEAGSYGQETRGLMRVHEFDKVEMVKITTPENSNQALEKLLSDASLVLDLLKLPYRVLLLATADISFASTKCYDIELYAPGLDRWLEVSSCSNFADFQARRGNIRYKNPQEGRNHFVHTLNGSGLALARLIAALLENYQQKDGSIIIPKALRPYLDGRKRFKK